MAATHSTAARNAATDAVTALLGANPRLKFRLPGTISAPGAVVADLPMSADGFGDAAAGTAVANAITDDANAAGNNATDVGAATLETAAGTIVIHCTVAAAGADINMANGLRVAPGDRVSVTSLTYTALTA